MNNSIKRWEQVRQDIINFIAKYTEKHSYAPSFQEIADELGIAKVTVHSHFHKLIEDGNIAYDTEYLCPRAYRLTGYEYSIKPKTHF